MTGPFLASLKLQKFRKFRELELNGLGRLNIILGSNNVGKTSVLESVYLLSNFQDPGPWRFLANVRDSANQYYPSATITNSTAWLFKDPDLQRTPEQRTNDPSNLGSGNLAVRAMMRDGTELVGKAEFRLGVETVQRTRGRLAASTEVERRPVRVIQIKTTLRRGDSETAKELSIHEEAPRIRAQAKLFPSVYSRPYAGWQTDAGLWSSVVRGGKDQEALEILRLFDPELEAVRILEEGGVSATLEVKRRTSQSYQPSSVYGAGFHRTLELLHAMISAKGGVLLIDELEVALHFRLLKRVANWLHAAAHELDVQVFITTHSLEAVDALLSVVPNHPQEIVAFRLIQGQTDVTAQRVEGPDLKILRDEYNEEVR
jgi:hypothetical protein